MPAASAAAAPPLLPPGVCARCHGLKVRPRSSLSVCQRRLKAGVLVRPTMTAPARFQFATGGPAPLAATTFNPGTPLGGGPPPPSTFSLILTRPPASSPTPPPPRHAAAAPRAAAGGAA